jgi:quercetin dioxygenase-like cupin family protein
MMHARLAARSLAAMAAMAATMLAVPGAQAQGGGIQRTVVQRGDVSVPGREAVVATVEVAPGVLAGRHTHPGDEVSYVMEGEGELLIDGQPPRKLKPGDAFILPAGTIHDARNTGSVPMKLVGVFTVEKGKPLASPAK